MRLLLLLLALVCSASAQTTYTGNPFPLFNTIRNGVGAPSSLLGNDGDFYVDKTPNAQEIYGPKYLGNWGAGTPIVGGSGSGSCGAATASVLGCVLIPASSGLAVDGSGNLVVSLAFTAPLVRTGPTISIQQATGSSNGYLSSSDWTRFNTVANGSWLPDPGTNGIVVRTSAGRDVTVQGPIGTIVGTGDTQTLTNKTVDGVTPTTFGFLDATSSIQTQLNGKQAALQFTGTGGKAVTATASGNSGHCAQWTSTGDIGDAGAACGTGGGGTTSPGGTNGQIEYNNGGAFGGYTLIPATNMPAHTGDVTSPAGSTVNTLATVNSNVGTFGSSTLCPTITVNGKGLVTAASQAACSGSSGPTGITQLTGDVTTPSSSSGSTAATLATVNSNVGSFGDSTHTVTLTVDAKGRITAVSTNAISGGGGGGSSDVTIGTLSALPSTCSAGALYFATDQPVGLQQLYGCSPDNTWTQLGALGASGGLAYTDGVLDIVTSVLPRLSAANTFLGLNAFQNGIQLTTLATGQPTCNSSTPGMIWYNGTGAGAAENLQACLWDGSAYGWASLASSGGGSYTAGSGLTLTGSEFSLTSPIAASFLPAFTGDITSSAGSSATTLATVNSAPGTTGDASHTSVITTNGKGLVTANSATPISITHSAVSDFSSAVASASAITSILLGGTSYTPTSQVLTLPSTIVQTNQANTFGAYAQTFSGNILFGTDAAFNIGANGANRPNNVYISQGVNVGIGGAGEGPQGVIFGSYAREHATAIGIVELENGLGTSFTALQFGGTTSSFPGLYLNGTELDAKLADASAFSSFGAHCYYLTGSGTAGMCDDGSSGINLVTNGTTRLNLSSTGGWTVHGALVGYSSPNLGGAGYSWGNTYTNQLQLTSTASSNGTCSSTQRGLFQYTQGTPDHLYVCAQTATSGTYAWTTVF